jgi:hypothetical protein
MGAQPNTIVRLNDYCVAEFFPQQVTMSSPIFRKIYNAQTGTHHIYNDNGSPTLNEQDHSATYVGPSQFVYMDQEVSMPYWDRYPDKFMTSTPGTYNSFNLVRFHFISGYDFSERDGLILGVKNKMNNGSYVFFASLFVTPDLFVDMVRFNTSPIYLADAVFDRYIMVYVPAVEQINYDYYNLPPEARGGEFGALITYNGTSYSGMVQDSPIIMTLDEVSRIDKVSISGEVYEMCLADEHYESPVLMDSMHQRFGAYIGESTQFDALEFYGTMVDQDGNLAFVEDLINMLSTNAKDNWVIAHQITVHEWIDGVKVVAGKYMQLQESDFDSPMYYRPILRNTGNAMAFEVDYTCRLYNRRNGEQIIRLASYQSFNAAKYGRSLLVIPLAAPVNSHKIVNKIVKSNLETTDMFVEQSYITTGNGITKNLQTGTRVTSFIPMFFNNNSISVSMKDVMPASDEISTTLIYRQGDLRFILMPFDNMFKFKVYTVNNRGRLVPMDLSDFGKFNMVLMNNNKKVKFSYLTDSGTSNPRNGELMFKIPQKDAESIITSSNREFYITLLAKDNTETVLYNGFWNDVTEKDVVDANIQKVRERQSEILSGMTSSSVFSSTVNLSVQQVKQPTLQFEQQSVSDMTVNIPGYVQPGKPNNDVSIVQIVPPASLTPNADSSQAKADAALGQALGNQASLSK